MIKHWGKFLSDRGRVIELRAQDIETKQAEYLDLLKRKKQLELDLADLEYSFFLYALEDWTIDEISQAKDKCRVASPESIDLTKQMELLSSPQLT